HERLEAQLAIEKQGRDAPDAVIESLKKGELNERSWLHGVWILAHLLGADASDELFAITKGGVFGFPRVREQAIRVLADLHDPVLVEHRLDASPADDNIAKRFAEVAQERGSEATLDVVIALGRLKWAQAPNWMSKNLKSLAPVVAHAAQQTLRRCGDWPEVLRLLGSRYEPPPRTSSRSIHRVALRALADQADERVVDWLAGGLRSVTTVPRQRQEYADLLRRFWNRCASIRRTRFASRWKR
ncbi:MAG: hypothetical protein FD138_664, partial [Planctomycetota bacterium]